MMVDIDVSEKEIKQRLQKILSTNFKFTGNIHHKILSCIDLTTLEGTDNWEKIENLCKKAKSFKVQNNNYNNVAAVCVYPVFVNYAKDLLVNTGVKTACVAGAFPSGQSSLEVKLAEVQYAVDNGADEVDMVISRGKFLLGQYDEVQNEIIAIKNICKQQQVTLKVILEIGELRTNENIYLASKLAIAAGADFIKTSTGKIPMGANPEGFLLMLYAIKSHFEKTGKKVGIKVAGGVAEPEQAITYMHLTNSVLGKEWLNNTLFRIGASRLVDKLEC